MTYKRKDIFRHRTKASKLSYDDRFSFALAARWWGITPHALRELPLPDQIEMLAVYHTKMQIEAVYAFEQYQEHLAAQRKRGRP